MTNGEEQGIDDTVWANTSDLPRRLNRGDGAVGPPNSQANPPMGIGFQQASLATQPVLTSATTVSNSRVDVAWTFPTNLSQTGFKIGVSTDSGKTFVETIVASASARSAQIIGLSGSTAYTFTVRAYNAGGDSSGSYTLGATTLINPPAAPSGLSATAVSSSQIDLAWNDVATETGYTIERSLTGTGGWTQIDTVGANVTTYADSTGLSGNTTYHYRVRATNAGGDSSYSAAASAATLLATPGSFTATAQSTSRINLAWADVSGETGYTIQRLDSGSTYVDLATVAAGVTSYSVANLDASTSYTFRICATSAGGNSAYAAPAGAATP
ncbi:MAG: fibronectin type III domain-containing protein, partial [Tepidisphaeraceae bacterium]